MRLYETIIVVGLLLTFLGRVIPKLRQSVIFKMMPILTGIVILLHLLFEGQRWQMVPMYVLTGAATIVALILIVKKKALLIKGKVLRGFLSVLFIVVIFISGLLVTLLGVVNLPEPSGTYEVGTKIFEMVDDTRQEQFTKDDDNRSILVKVWYPAEIDEDMKVEKYWDSEGVTGEAYSLNAGMGTFWYSHLAVSDTNSYIDADISDVENQYPVIIYSPSFYGLNTENTMLCEELASQGYVVFAISHTYESIVSIMPDGEAIHGDLEYFNEVYNDNYEQEVLLYEQYREANNRDESVSILRQILTVDDSTTEMIRIRTQDIHFVLDEIEILNESDFFESRLDMQKVGVIGWSFGGASAQEAMMVDDRIMAAVNMDGWPYGENFGAGSFIEKPFMMFCNGDNDEMDESVADMIYERADSDTYRIVIEDTTHINFWDFPMLLGVYKYIGYWGKQDPYVMNEIHQAFTVRFFDKYLKAEDIDIIDIADEGLPLSVESKQVQN